DARSMENGNPMSAGRNGPTRRSARLEKNWSTASKKERNESPRLAGASTGLTVGALDAGRVELAGHRDAREGEGDVELFEQDLERAPHAVGPGGRQAPDHRAADHHRAGAERQRLEHVGA